MSRNNILELGVAVITNLEATHRAGYVFRDLKLDNLMLGFGQIAHRTVTKFSAF